MLNYITPAQVITIFSGNGFAKKEAANDCPCHHFVQKNLNQKAGQGCSKDASPALEALDLHVPDGRVLEQTKRTTTLNLCA